MKKVLQAFLFCFGSFILYAPNLGRSFASDDHLVMKRVGMDKIIWIRGFFRPLSDITLYFNYMIGGFNPMGYYLLNILLHGVSTFLFFRFCSLWKWTDDDALQRRYALLASLLFLCYPFHSECVVWVLGRASLAANLFGIAALLAVVSSLRLGLRILLCCVFYFIGMAGYESVLLLPVMVLVILWRQEPGFRWCVPWGLALGGTLGLHIFLRIVVSGSMAGEYGGMFFENPLLKYGANLLRVAMRFFLPPMGSITLMTALFVIVLGAIGYGLWRFWTAANLLARGYLIRLVLLFAVACAVPVLSGVSTHTSESDRFLYFPSFFLCALVALLFVTAARVWVFAAVLICYECVFVELNSINWVKASATTAAVVSAILRQPPGVRVFFVNLPDERDGAYIFRLGLPEALLMKGWDTSRLVIVSHLTRDEELSGGGAIVKVRRSSGDSFSIRASDGGSWECGAQDVILFWDGKRVVAMTPPELSNSGIN